MSQDDEPVEYRGPSSSELRAAWVRETEGPARSIHAVAVNNPLYVDRNRTRVTIDFEGLLTLREVYEHLASLETLTNQLVTVDYRRQEDYC